ncbi:cellulose synthase [Nocardioides pantholopis]|uniref:cellulose synthase n=1 Tax=Nocardioides pantholopis TaxID=2483798 RepID=UPI000FDA389C|nr:cellulose synthase [Nocardioides pantholopis]
MDDVTWGALTLTLTLFAGLWAWVSFRRRGLAAGLRGVAIALLPLAAYLTDTLRMFTRIADAVGDWAVRLVFSPVVWTGIVLAGVAVVLFLLAGVLDRRGSAPRERTRPAAPGRKERAVGGATAAPQAGAAGDPEMDEIEALLRRRGIS